MDSFTFDAQVEIHCRRQSTSLPLDEAVASRAVFVTVSGSDGLMDG